MIERHQKKASITRNYVNELPKRNHLTYHPIKIRLFTSYHERFPRIVSINHALLENIDPTPAFLYQRQCKTIFVFSQSDLDYPSNSQLYYFNRQIPKFLISSSIICSVPYSVVQSIRITLQWNSRIVNLHWKNEFDTLEKYKRKNYNKLTTDHLARKFQRTRNLPATIKHTQSLTTCSRSNTFRCMTPRCTGHGALISTEVHIIL